MTDKRVWIELKYQSGNFSPGWYHVSPSVADAIRQVNEAIRRLLEVFDGAAFIEVVMLSGETHYYPADSAT